MKWKWDEMGNGKKWEWNENDMEMPFNGVEWKLMEWHGNGMMNRNNENGNGNAI